MLVFLVDTKYLHRCSAFLIGRDERVCDILLLHESISKQHAVLQYRKVPYVSYLLFSLLRMPKIKVNSEGWLLSSFFRNVPDV